jgi:hypothetical protein
VYPQPLLEFHPWTAPPAKKISTGSSAKALRELAKVSRILFSPAQKWVINESILASLTGCFRPAIKKFVENHRSFINLANNTHGLGPRPQPGKARTNPDAIPELVKNFKKDALGQPF